MSIFWADKCRCCCVAEVPRTLQDSAQRLKVCHELLGLFRFGSYLRFLQNFIQSSGEDVDRIHAKALYGHLIDLGGRVDEQPEFFLFRWKCLVGLVIPNGEYLSF